MSQITLTVNGKRQTVDVEPSTPLLYVLRNDLDLQGPRFGCGLGQCGACTVIINGEAVRSCITPVSAVAGAEITTLEGPRQERQAASAAAGVDRRAGAAVRVLPERPDHDREGAARPESPRRPTRRSARRWRRTLCRCMTYYRVQAAIKRAARWRGRWRTHDRPHAATSSRPPACWSSASARCLRSRPHGPGRRIRAGRRPLSRSRLPAARLVDRDPRRQHRDVLRRQDRSAGRAPAPRSARSCPTSWTSPTTTPAA